MTRDCVPQLFALHHWSWCIGQMKKQKEHGRMVFIYLDVTFFSVIHIEDSGERKQVEKRRKKGRKE